MAFTFSAKFETKSSSFFYLFLKIKIISKIAQKRAILAFKN